MPGAVPSVALLLVWELLASDPLSYSVILYNSTQ